MADDYPVYDEDVNRESQTEQTRRDTANTDQITTINTAIAQSPIYRQWLATHNGGRNLTEADKQDLIRTLNAAGLNLPPNTEINDDASVQPINNSTRNRILVGAVIASALTGPVLEGLGVGGGATGAGAAGGTTAGGTGATGISTPATLGGFTTPGVGTVATDVGVSATPTVAGNSFNIGSILRYAIPGASSIIDTILANRANNQANDYLQNATTEARGLQQDLYDRTTGTAREVYDRNSALYQPYQQAGLQSLSTLLGLANQNREDFQLPTLAEAQAMPGYQFGLDQGLKGVSNSAAARGGLLTGGAVKAADRYANDYATTKYGELANQKLAEYNANTANFDRPFNRNLSLLGAGQYGTTGMANAGSDYADLMNRAGTAYTNASTDLVTGAANANAQTTLNNSNGDRRTIQNLADLFREYFGGRA